MDVARWSWVVAGLAASVVADARSIAPSTPAYVGPAGIVPAMPEQTMTVWHAGAATCGGQPVAATRPPNPLPSLSWGSAGLAPRRLAFRIDAGGRPTGIRHDGSRYAPADDVAPSLAAAAFVPGTARADCSITYSPERLPIDQVPVDVAMAYTVFPTAGRPVDALWQRIRPAASTCFEPTPAALNRAYPDFTAIPGEPGRPLWSMVGYDIDVGGKPVRVRTVDGSRSVDLDAASRRAVQQSRFAKGARQGCLYPYWKIADPMPAPALPAREAFPAEPEACKALGDWARAPRLIYPDNYRRRGIEGWAIVSYDVAPWGSVGNVKVIAAEPTSDFGEAARSMFAALSRKPSATGAGGCIDRVRYKMGKPGMPAPADEDPRPLY